MDEEYPRPAAEGPSVASGQAPAADPGGEADELVRKLREEVKQLTEQLLRNQAEMDNVRKRLAREKEEFLQYNLLQTVQSLLPILDGFELALENRAEGESYRQGVELIYSQFYNALQRMGLKAVETAGQPFDPNVHEAIATVETDAHPEMHVVDEMQRGYFFKSRLLRPARVRVAKNSSRRAEDSSAE
jgi:molecular chaperone GrpE